MTTADIWIPCGISIAITLIGWIYTAGRTAGRINDQEKTLERHDDQLSDHEEKLGTHAVAIAEQKAWRDGYNAGKGH